MRRSLEELIAGSYQSYHFWEVVESDYERLHKTGDCSEWHLEPIQWWNVPIRQAMERTSWPHRLVLWMSLDFHNMSDLLTRYAAALVFFRRILSVILILKACDILPSCRIHSWILQESSDRQTILVLFSQLQFLHIVTPVPDTHGGRLFNRWILPVGESQTIVIIGRTHDWIILTTHK